MSQLWIVFLIRIPSECLPFVSIGIKRMIGIWPLHEFRRRRALGIQRVHEQFVRSPLMIQSYSP